MGRKEDKKILISVAWKNRPGRDVCRGIYQYARLHAPHWELLHADPNVAALTDVKTWGLEGIIGILGRSDLSEAGKAAAPYCVNIHGGEVFSGLPQIGISNRAIGEVAADYFMTLGFTHFAYFGLPGQDYSDGRWDGYRTRLAEHDFTASQFENPKIKKQPIVPLNYEPLVQDEFEQWLINQPKPLALFIVDDLRSSLIYQTCRRLNLIIPDDVAILGVNDDDIYCYKTNPPLSSIWLPFRVVGYRAAQMMAQMLSSGEIPTEPILLEPGGVTERASTAIISIEDKKVIEALRFISENAGNRITVDQIAKAVGLSLRVLEKRFSTHLNCSPQTELRRAQIEIAKNALRETDLTIEEIADIAGFSSGNYLSQTFKKLVGQTPGIYRRSHR